MKKMILLTVLLLITTSVYAESPTDKGVYSLGGSISYQDRDVSYSYSDLDGVDIDSDYNTFLFSPSFRYFIFDNVALGASFMYEKTSGYLDSKSYGIGPTLRYYLPYKTANPFFEVGYTYLKTKVEHSIFSPKTTSNDYSIGFGLDYFISRNVSIEPKINYSWRDYKTDSRDSDEKTLYVGIGINLFIY